MDVEIVRDVAFDLAQKAQELPASMAWVATPDDRAGGGVESGKQRERPVPRVIVGAPLDLSRTHRQQWLRSVQRLNLALFVYAQDDCLLRRIQI